MSQPMFNRASRGRDTTEIGQGWASPARAETAQETTDRLVMHGLSVGKHSVQQLAFHAGFAPTSNRRAVVEALERLEARGLARCEGKGWVRV